MTEHSSKSGESARPDKTLRGCLIAGLAVAVVVIFAAAAFGVYAMITAEDEPVLVSGLEIGKVQAPGFYALSPQQQEDLSQYGYPDSFLILFFENTLSSGQRTPIREETWYYHQSGYEITYRNGEKYTESHQQPETEELFHTPYRPEMFIREMAMEQVLAVAGQDTYVENPIEKILLGDADLYFTKGLVFGISDGELRYLETVPLSAE